MHKIWIVNLEEVLPQVPTREHLVQQLSRYVHLVEAGDLFITSLELSGDYLNYVCALKGLPDPREWLIKVNYHIPYSLCDCIQRDKKLMKTLQELGRRSEHELEHYIYSPGIEALAEKTGIRLSFQDEGLIRRLNDKIYFHELADELGIEAAPALVAGNIDELEKAVTEICPTPLDRAMLKKSYSGGGFGNLAGDSGKLLAAAPSWFDGKP